jgi:hypothetical protein
MRGQSGSPAKKYVDYGKPSGEPDVVTQHAKKAQEMLKFPTARESDFTIEKLEEKEAA